MILPDDGATGKDQTPAECLAEAMARLDAGKLEGVDKCLVIFLDNSPGNYRTAYHQAGMTCSQIVALLEYMKAIMILNMNPPPPGKTHFPL